MLKPEVSIIMPAYNAANFIRASIESIQNQSFPLWECIVVDDLSTDNTFSIVETMAKEDHRIKLIRAPKKLLTASARNLALKHASGRYIAFLDSDDLWHVNKLEIQINFMKQFASAFSFHSYQHINSMGEPLAGQIIKVPNEIRYKQLLKGNKIGCLTAIYDSKQLGHVLMKDGFHTREDYICWLDILKKTNVAHGIDQVLASYRIHTSASTASKLISASRQWAVYRKYLKLSILKSIIYMFQYAFSGIRKHRRIN